MSGFKDLPHRNWEELRDLWIDHLPAYDFGEKFPEPTLWQLLKLQGLPSKLEDGQELPYISGIRESVFREIIVLCRKFTYCRNVSLNGNMNGQPTWAIIAAYDACFFAAKTICYMLGIVSVARDSKFYVDIFYSREQKTGKVRNKIYDTIKIYSLSERLTHTVVWGLLARLSRTLTVPDGGKAVLRALVRNDFDSFTRLRNRYLYDGSAWYNNEDADICDLIKPVSNFEIFFAASNAGSKEKEDLNYIQTIHLLSDVLLHLFGTIADLAPAISNEVKLLLEWPNYSGADLSKFKEPCYVIRY